MCFAGRAKESAEEVAMKRPHTKGEGVATQEGGARRSRRLALVIGVVVGLGLHLSGCLGALGAEDTLEWREEVALHDGEILIVTRWMQFVPGEPFKTMPGSRRLTFTHPTTGQAIVWENAGKIGSRVNPKMLDFDVGRPFLVTMAQSGPDYDGFGCPTPPYVVFRHDAGTWVRVPVAELPSRLVRMNLVTFPNRERLKAEGYFIRAAVTARSYKEIPGADNYALNATVD